MGVLEDEAQGDEAGVVVRYDVWGLRRRRGRGRGGGRGGRRKTPVREQRRGDLSLFAQGAIVDEFSDCGGGELGGEAVAGVVEYVDVVF